MFTTRVDRGANRSDTKNEFVEKNMVLGFFKWPQFLTVVHYRGAGRGGDKTPSAGNGLFTVR